MKIYKIFFLLFLSTALIACDKDDAPDDDRYLGPCDKPAVVNLDLYRETKTKFYRIKNAEIHGDCLEIQISSGGCDGETWVIDLIDSGAIAESLPPQRSLKIALENKEVCLAIATRTISFDLKPLRVSHSEVILNLEGWEESLLYSY